MTRAAGVIAALVAAGCTQPAAELEHTEQPLIGGTLVADGEDYAVVALDSSVAGSSFCSGTLISPSVVLTAAHCLESFRGSVFFGNDTTTAGNVQKTLERKHPEWTGNLGANDIGVVLLSFSQDPELPIPLNRSPATDHIGDAYRLVGFGQYQRTPPASDGRKRTGYSTITGTAGADVLTTGDVDVSICFGDSGGPGLLEIDGVEYVAGVHSYTAGSNCNPPQGDTRVDLHVDDFLQPFIDDFDPVCKRDGTCARIGCSADPDCEPCGPDGTCVSDCALPDPDCPTQGFGDLCWADTQCMTGICVYWQQDPQTKFCTEPCESNGDCPSGMSCVTRPEVGKVCYYDDTPQGVLGDECSDAVDCGSQICHDGACVRECDLSLNVLCPRDFTCTAAGDGSDAYYCIAEATGGEGGGCSTGGSASLPLALLLLLALRRLKARPE